jgi:KaiC domain protein
VSDESDADADEDWFEAAVGGETGDTSGSSDTAEWPDDGGPADADGTDEIDREAAASTDTDDAGDTDPFGETDDTDPFGETDDAGDTDPFGAADEPFGEADDETLFEEDFGAAFDAGGEGFEEEYETEIPRIDTGVQGLDEMIQGGVPERSLMVVMGSAGTGKTTFGLQFLHHGVQNGEKVVYITLEETREAILAAAGEKGWDYEQYVEDGQLAIVDLDPIEMANSLSSIRSDLPRLVDDFGAERLVLDSVSLLEMMYDQQAERRTEVFDFTKALKRAGVTTMLTSEASESNPYASRHGIIEYLTDAVFVLQYVRSEFRETRLAVEIQKIRNANHSRETKPYEITGDGISVYQQANIF